MFNAAGVPIAERPPTNPTRKDDLVPNQVTSNSEVLRQGAEAMNRLSSNHSRDWDDWLKVLAALGIGRHAAMLEGNANEPRGYKYCKAFARWLRCHEAFQAIDQADRKRMFDCWDNLSAIEEWRAGLSPVQLSKWNYPPTVLREWKRSQRPSAEPQRSPALRAVASGTLLAPEELRRQLEQSLGLRSIGRSCRPIGAALLRDEPLRPRHGGTADRDAREKHPAIQGCARRAQVVEKFAAA